MLRSIVFGSKIDFVRADEISNIFFQAVGVQNKEEFKFLYLYRIKWERSVVERGKVVIRRHSFEYIIYVHTYFIRCYYKYENTAVRKIIRKERLECGN